MEVKAVRGMHDLYGDELARWQWVEGNIRDVLTAFGYEEIRMPALEAVEVFSHTVGDETDIVEKQMYTITHGTETLVLRPEGTASFIRAVVEHQLHRLGGPQRYYYNLPMFRHERPQKGRLRQFHQMGVELILDPSPEADGEIITVLDQICRTFHLTEYEVRINSVGCGDCRPAYKELLKDYLRPRLAEVCGECQKRFERSPLRILDDKKEICRTVTKGAPLLVDHLCEHCRLHHNRVKDCLKAGGVSYLEDPTIVRGLDYYSRTAFEFTSTLLGAQSAVGGGGRYDGLSARFGEKAFPAVGFAMGMERMLLMLEEKKAFPQLERHPLFFFAALGPEAIAQLYPLSLSLKRQGIWAEMNYDSTKSLKSLMKHADRLNAAYAVLCGETELKEGKVLLKNMRAGTQASVELAQLPTELLKLKGL